MNMNDINEEILKCTALANLTTRIRGSRVGCEIVGDGVLVMLACREDDKPRWRKAHVYKTSLQKREGLRQAALHIASLEAEVALQETPQNMQNLLRRRIALNAPEDHVVLSRFNDPTDEKHRDVRYALSMLRPLELLAYEMSGQAEHVHECRMSYMYANHNMLIINEIWPHEAEQAWDTAATMAHARFVKVQEDAQHRSLACT